MDNSIQPSMIKTSDIENIIKANTIIQNSSNDIDTSIDDIKSTVALLSDNPNKAIDLLISTLKYTIRNSKVSSALSILDICRDMSKNNLDIDNLDRFMKLIPSLIQYAQSSYISSPKIVDELIALEIYMISLKGSLLGPNIDDILSDSDIRLSAVLDSIIGVLEECIQDYTMNESVKTTLRKAGDAVSKKVAMFSVADRNLSNRINDKFNRFMKEYREDKKTASYETIVKQSLDLSRLIKQIISSSLVAILIPGGGVIKLIGGALTLLVQFANNKKTDDKYKGVVVNDLKFELRILREKIKDAEGKGDNTAKYKLMRCENQVERAIDRINYGLAASQH